MSERWQCPHCNTVNVKPDYVLQFEQLRQALGLVGIGKTSEPAPRCIQCNFETDVNAMLRGEYDYAGETPQDRLAGEKPGAISGAPAAPAQPDRLVLFAVGGIVIALICLGVLLVAGIGQFVNQTKEEKVPSPQSTLRATSSPRAIVPTATTTLAVRMLEKSEAQKIFEGQNIPFLARKAVEQYSDDELNQMGTTLTYTIYLDKSEPLAWGMGWCTTTEAILAQNFNHIRYTFILDGKRILLNRFVRDEYYSENMQGYCRRYYTVLTDWKPGEYLIETTIEYDQPINDGWYDYPAGTKTYEYRVVVAP